MEITSGDFDDLVWPAVRYALGRKTYVVDQVCRVVIKYIDDVSDYTRLQLLKEIQYALDNKEAGMEMDELNWKEVIRALSDEGPEEKD